MFNPNEQNMESGWILKLQENKFQFNIKKSCLRVAYQEVEDGSPLYWLYFSRSSSIRNTLIQVPTVGRKEVSKFIIVATGYKI